MIFRIATSGKCLTAVIDGNGNGALGCNRLVAQLGVVFVLIKHDIAHKPPIIAVWLLVNRLQDGLVLVFLVLK